MLLPRRIAAIVVADARRRIPFLFPPLSAAERGVIVKGLLQAADFAKGATQTVLARSADTLAEFW